MTESSELYPSPLDVFDQDTQLSAGYIAHDLVSQLRDKYNKHLPKLTDKDAAMRAAILNVLAEVLLDEEILAIQVGQLTAMYTRINRNPSDTQTAVEMLSRVTHDEPVLRMMHAMGVPDPFEVVAHLEASEAAIKKAAAEQEKSDD